MWKNEKDNDREKRRVRGRKRREREKERRKKSARKREENKTPHASRGITSCIYAGGFFAALIAMIVISVATGGKAPAFVTCKIGVACNLAILACFVGIFIRGLL